MLQRSPNVYVLITGIMVAALLGACVSPPHVQDTREQDLRERVQGFWDARIARDPEAVARYQWNPAGWDTVAARPDDRPREAIRYRSVTIGDVRFLGPDHTRAQVDVVVRYTIPVLSSQVLGAELQTAWIFHQGQWYHSAEGWEE